MKRGNKKGWGLCAESGKSQKGLSGEFLRLAGQWGGDSAQPVVWPHCFLEQRLSTEAGGTSGDTA